MKLDFGHFQQPRPQILERLLEEQPLLIHESALVVVVFFEAPYFIPEHCEASELPANIGGRCRGLFEFEPKA